MNPLENRLRIPSRSAGNHEGQRPRPRGACLKENIDVLPRLDVAKIEDKPLWKVEAAGPLARCRTRYR
jgi:hypothetical protein